MTRTVRERSRLALLAAGAAFAIAVAATLLGAALAGGDAEQAATARAQLERSNARVGPLPRELACGRPRLQRSCASRLGARRGRLRGGSAKRRAVREG